MEAKTLYRSAKIINIPLNKIEIELHYGEFDDRKIVGLAESIRKNGLIFPIAVRKKPAADGYVLVDGVLRYFALCYLQATSAPALILSLTPAEAGMVRLIKSLTEQPKNYFEQADYLAQLLQCGNYKRREITELTGLSLTEIERRLRLLKLPQNEREFLLRQGCSLQFATRFAECNAQKRAETINSVMAESVGDYAILEHFRTQKKENPKNKAAFKEQSVLCSLNDLITQINQNGGKAKLSAEVTDGATEYRLILYKAPQKAEAAVFSAESLPNAPPTPLKNTLSAKVQTAKSNI